MRDRPQPSSGVPIRPAQLPQARLHKLPSTAAPLEGQVLLEMLIADHEVLPTPLPVPALAHDPARDFNEGCAPEHELHKGLRLEIHPQQGRYRAARGRARVVARGQGLAAVPTPDPAQPVGLLVHGQGHQLVSRDLDRARESLRRLGDEHQVRGRTGTLPDLCPWDLEGLELGRGRGDQLGVAGLLAGGVGCVDPSTGAQRQSHAEQGKQG